VWVWGATVVPVVVAVKPSSDADEDKAIRLQDSQLGQFKGKTGLRRLRFQQSSWLQIIGALIIASQITLCSLASCYFLHFWAWGILLKSAGHKGLQPICR